MAGHSVPAIIVLIKSGLPLLHNKRQDARTLAQRARILSGCLIAPIRAALRAVPRRMVALKGAPEALITLPTPDFSN
jgi:hypothetical protein